MLVIDSEIDKRAFFYSALSARLVWLHPSSTWCLPFISRPHTYCVSFPSTNRSSHHCLLLPFNGAKWLHWHIPNRKTTAQTGKLQRKRPGNTCGQCYGVIWSVSRHVSISLYLLYSPFPFRRVSKVGLSMTSSRLSVRSSVIAIMDAHPIYTTIEYGS